MKSSKTFVILWGAALTFRIGMVGTNHVNASANTNVKTKQITKNNSRHFVIETKNQKFIHSHDVNASLSKQDLSAKQWIAWNESKNNYHAKHGIYYGKYQLGLSLLHSDYSAANQELAANNYVQSRYGTWSNAKRHWMKYNWY